jgi:hypothetical protein
MKRSIGTILLFLAATSVACASTITGGNPAVFATNTDGWSNFTVVDQNNPINGTGEITSWQLYSSYAGGQVELVIVAPTTYAIVGTSSVETTAVVGTNTFTLATPISVTGGDYVGFYEETPSLVVYAYNGPDVFSSDTAHVALFTANGSGSPTSPLSFVGSADRIYSINVSGVPEGGAGFAYLLFAGAACFGVAVFASRKRNPSALAA